MGKWNYVQMSILVIIVLMLFHNLSPAARSDVEKGEKPISTFRMSVETFCKASIPRLESNTQGEQTARLYPTNHSLYRAG